MLIAQTLSGMQLIVLGLLILVTAFVLRRGIVLRRRSQNRQTDLTNPLAGAHAEQLAASAGVNRLEVRLHDFDREVEGRAQTTIALLEQLVADADRESARLLRLLGEARQRHQSSPAQTQPLSVEQRRMIAHLAAAGYSAGQVSGLVERSVSEIQAILADEDHSEAA